MLSNRVDQGRWVGRTGRFDERLSDAEWRGRLKQVYSRVAVADGADGKPPLTLLHPTRPMVPFGVEVPWAGLWPKEGDLVELRQGRLTLTSQSGFMRSVDLHGRGQSLAFGSVLAGCRMALRLQLAGVALPDRTRAILGEVVPGAEGIELKEQILLSEGLERLATSLTDEEQAGYLVFAVLNLLGLGSGSTPSGDDILLGALATSKRLAACGWIPDDMPRYLDAILLDKGRDRTTFTSCQSFDQAREGAYPEALLNVVQALGMPGLKLRGLQWSVDGLAEVGARSGQDMLAGVWAVARVVSSSV